MVSEPNLTEVTYILNVVGVHGKLTGSSVAEAMFTNMSRKPNSMVAKTARPLELTSLFLLF